MNKSLITGNLTKDPQYFKTQSGISYTRFTVATTSRYGQSEETAFISCIAWRQSADYLNQYARKGSSVELEGHITTGSYDDKTTGKKIYTTDVTVDRVQLKDKKESQDNNVYGKDSLKHEEKEDEGFDIGNPLEIDPDSLPF